jgi:hypothetical protein
VQSGDHPENNLVRFGYTLLTRDESRKKLKKKNPSIILGYLLELIIEFGNLVFFLPLKSGEFGPFIPI